VATLHVRNVPDDLYERLREAAEREGRSIGAEALKLIERALFDPRRLREELPVHPRRSPFLQRFAESGKEIVVRAQEQARELRAPEVTPAHVLLAMLDDDVMRKSLEAAGITEETVRERLPRGEGSPRSRIPFAAETKKMLETALRTSLATKHKEITPEQVLFALEHVELPIPRGSLARAIAAEDYCAVVLTGNDDEWTEQLNGLAAEGWELFSITPVGSEIRAILRRA